MSYPIDIAKMFDTNDEQVTAVIGGDFFRWLDSQLENPQPIDYGCRGPVHHRGKVLQDHFVPETTFPHQALSFLAVDKNGKVIIADAAEYAGMKQIFRNVPVVVIVYCVTVKSAKALILHLMEIIMRWKTNIHFQASDIVQMVL